ncbi:MAG: peptidoglycan DD-metalloendopeptidase family protein [Flavobacteriales bacterium]|nr:peptidoglycan DD-metalloendopeptidase family protein [Flavobacteriales bacterium]
MLLSAIALFVVLLLPILTYGQTKEELQKKKKELEKNISYTGILLNETIKNKEASLHQLSTLKIKISYHRSLIRNINKEIKLMDRQIAENNDIIRALENDLIQVKEEYAKMLFYAYKNRNSYERLVFVFSSKDFNQAQKRLKYLQQYSTYRKEQADLILSTKDLIADKNSALEKKKETKRRLISEKEAEKKELSKDKEGKDKVYSKLKSNEEKLKSDLKKDKKAANKLDVAIANIIAEEIRLARIAAQNKKKFGLTPEEAKLSEDFRNNKGKLPWPLKRAIITGTFGVHPHPILTGIEINNNGIDLSTNKGATSRAIFEGVVTAVIIMPNSNIKAVIVRHGDFFSVYGNLQEVFVKKGDNIMLKQELGVIFTDEAKFKTVGHLEIWRMSDKGTVKLDPQKWLAKKSKPE